MSDQPQLPALTEVQVRSTRDGVMQPCLCAPAPAESRAAGGGPRPLLVFLHTWGGDYRQDNSTWHAQAHARGWHYLHPEFRGPNVQPTACGSELAQQDVIDALDWALVNLAVDPTRIYLAGCSGGGHMAMLMAAMFPSRFTAVSAWVGISDLARWHARHAGPPLGRYARDIEGVVGGAPGSSPQVDRQLHLRSPIHHLQHAANAQLPLDIHAGVHDGHTGSVPVDHSLHAFNVYARTLGKRQVTELEIRELLENRQLRVKQSSDSAPDPEYGRAIHLRRVAGACRVTIFEGGHEALPPAACAWLAARGGEGAPTSQSATSVATTQVHG